MTRRARRRRTTPGPTVATELSRVELRNGDHRSITLLSRPDDRPAICITLERNGHRFSFRYLRQVHIEAIREVLTLVHDQHWHGRWSTRIRSGEFSLQIGAARGGSRPPAILLSTLDETGSQVGAISTLTNGEIEALGEAVDLLEAMLSEAA